MSIIRYTSIYLKNLQSITLVCQYQCIYDSENSKLSQQAYICVSKLLISSFCFILVFSVLNTHWFLFMSWICCTVSFLMIVFSIVNMEYVCLMPVFQPLNKMSLFSNLQTKNP